MLIADFDSTGRKKTLDMVAKMSAESWLVYCNLTIARTTPRDPDHGRAKSLKVQIESQLELYGRRSA